MAKLNADSRFSLAPALGNLPRSRFVRDQKTVTSFNVGRAIPFFIEEVLPGDQFTVDTSKVVRLQTLLTPIFDDIYLDTYYFYVPSRLCWTHWKEFMGENTESAWIPETEYSVPQITAPAGGWNVGTIADYLGIRTGVGNISVSALPFRAYALICNYFMRDENLTDPLNIPLGDANQTGSNGDSYVNDVANGGMPFKMAKFHDYYSSALKSPQKGPSVSIDLASTAVVGNGYTLGLTDGTNFAGFTGGSNTSTHTSEYGALVGSTFSGGNLNNLGLGVPTATQLGDDLYKSGLTLASGNAVTISELRTAIAIQQFYESLSRYGSRYSEILRGQFRVSSPDARLQNPEYLGGNRIALAISQSVQSSETGNTPQGNTTGYSVTTDTHSDFSHGFVEHGYVIGIMCARYKHTYQQGIERFWSRKTRFQYYWPAFNGLSEQAILNKEIFAQGSTVINPNTGKPYDEEVFGYQENYADYRYKPNKVTGMMRSDYSESLDIWHLADDYSQLPSLSDEWIREDASTVNRVIAVSDKLSDQLLADIYVRNVATRSMPIYSIPGLNRI